MSSYVIGLTGGIGSGKTTIANMFLALGIELVDADIIAREVVQPKSKALIAIAQHFGGEYININGELNRAQLRTRIFNHADDKIWLNNLLHPLINAQIRQKLNKTTSPYCLLVAPLLIENKLMHLVNRILVIDVDKEIQISRTLQRDTSSLPEVKAIIASQASRKERLRSADDIIENNSASLLDISHRVNELHQKYLSIAHHSQN